MNPARRTTQAASTALVLATAGGLLTAVAAPAASAATATCNSPVYKRQLFSNATFSGTPKKTDCDASIAENWGANAPATGLPRDNFGVRWTLTRDFGSGGPFTLTAAAQDGIRVYVDGQIKVNLWKNVTTTQKKTVNLTIPAHKHTLRIDYVNWTGNANVNFAYAPRTSATVDKVKPLAPTGPAVTYDKATGKAKLTWAGSKEMDLAGYRVFRRTDVGSFGTRPVATTTATSYTDTTLPLTGEKFAYEIRAYDKAGNESAGTADLAVTTVDRVAPGVPQDVALVGSTVSKGMRIGWSTVEGAVSYVVYRAPEVRTDNGDVPGTYTRIGSATGLSYGDASAVESAGYYYLVTAVDAAGNESARSAAVMGRLWDDVPPPAVTGLTVTPTEYGFELNWDANPAEDLKWYRLYRGVIADRDEDGTESCYLSLAREYLPVASTSFTYTAVSDSYSYTALLDGETGCFFIDAVDDFGNSSFKWTDEGTAVLATEFDMRPSVATPEGSPLELTATGAEGDAGNRLDWSWSAAAQETTGYRVHRWNPATKAYEQIADVGADTNDYYDTGAPRGTTSFYWVTTVATDGTESAPAGAWAVNTPAT